jgi:uncharacterized protein with PQ loop repeat
VIRKSKYIKISKKEYKDYLLYNWRVRFDKVIVVLGLVNVVATIPQITQVWHAKNSDGVSIVAWSYYVMYTAVLLVYAVSIKSKPMIFMYTGNTIVYSLVLGSVIIFR